MAPSYAAEKNRAGIESELLRRIEMRKQAKKPATQRWLVATLDEIADLAEEAALKWLPPPEIARDLKNKKMKRNNMTNAEAAQKMEQAAQAGTQKS